MFGYVDRDGDGWRDMPDGSPLVFTYAATPTQLDRQFVQLWKKDMDADRACAWMCDIAKWPDLRKESKLQKLQDWALAWSADYPDGENFFQLLYGPNCGSSNDGCFQLPEFDALYDKASALPPGPERQKLYDEMARIVAAYAPWKLSAHRKRNYDCSSRGYCGVAQASVPARRIQVRRHRSRGKGVRKELGNSP